MNKKSSEIRRAAWQKETVDWRETQRDRFDLYISEVVVEEAGRGDESAASRRLGAIEDIQVRQLDKQSVDLAKELIEQGAVPRKALDDALHLAVAAVNGMDFLLTWKFRHIDNAEMKPKIRKVIESDGYQCPEIATPIELMGVHDDD